MIKNNLPPCTLHQISEHVWWLTPEDRIDRPSLSEKGVVLLDDFFVEAGD